MSTEKEYRTHQILIKKGHRMFPYFQEMTQNAKNMYNTTNFYLRQVYTALKNNKELQPLQHQVLDELHAHLPLMNETQKKAYEKKKLTELKKPEDKRKKVTLKTFEMPTEKTAFLSYDFLDALFKDMSQNDYRSLPTQSAQAVMKKVLENWKSFFESNNDYKQNPSKYTGKPRIPRYSKKSEKEVYFTNQDCVIKENKFLKFPKTKQKLNIGKLAKVEGKLKEVRVIPVYDHYKVECVFEVEKTELQDIKPTRMMSIDLGIDNLATIVTNTGLHPVLVKGKHVKSINAYYNKLKGHYLSVLRQGKSEKEGPFTSRRLEKIHEKRHLKIKDIFHKVSFQIVNLAESEKVDTIILGHNKNWKQSSNMGRRNNQNFCSIPHSQLIEMIQYKAKQRGINVEVIEESYTSKASFLDDDFIPTYAPNVKVNYSFSGVREKRGLYIAATGEKISADVNGSANIMKKYVLNHLKKSCFNVSSVCVKQPSTLYV